MIQNRLDSKFNELKLNKEKALIVFVTSGDPTLKVTRQMLHYCQEIGVDCVELGVPFSDPLADGPVIQGSSHRALKKNVQLPHIMQLVREERTKGLKIPVVLMSSFNPLHKFGLKRLATEAKRSGIDGFIIPDLPIHESNTIMRETKLAGLSLIFLVAPTTREKRKRLIQSKSKGFIYYMSVTGVTGARKRSSYPFKRDVIKLKSSGKTPVCVGFGVSSPSEAKAISLFSDGVIVGSAIVKDLFERSKTNLSSQSKKHILSFVHSIKK